MWNVWLYTIILDKKELLVYVLFVREMFFKEALNMTDNMNKFNKVAALLQNKARGAGYKKAAAAVNLAAEFMARGVNVQHGQNEK